MDAANAFVNSARPKEAMENAGVMGAPNMCFTTRA